MYADLNQPQLEALKTLAAGATVSAAAKAAGVHRSTIYNWCRDHAAFRAALTHSKIQAAEVIDDEIRDLAALALDTIRQLLQSEKTPAAIKLKAAQYLLAETIRPAMAEVRANLAAASIPQSEPASARPTAPQPAPVRQISTPRNALCPCRSGEKYKRCCGKAAPPVLYPNAA